MGRTDLQHWHELCVRCGLRHDIDAVHQSLVEAYGEPHRAYHTLRHIAECLAEFDMARGLASTPDVVELAIWFHDAVYDPKESDNEARSTRLAVESLAPLGLDAQALLRVERLILVTDHRSVPEDDDARLLVDLDLAVLAWPAERFDEYERQIRREYAWVSEAMFREGRRRILQAFLDRPRIYRTADFYARNEVTARENLRRSVALLTH